MESRVLPKRGMEVLAKLPCRVQARNCLRILHQHLALWMNAAEYVNGSNCMAGCPSMFFAYLQLVVHRYNGLPLSDIRLRTSA